MPEDRPLDLRPDDRERVVRATGSRASPTTRRPSGCRSRRAPRPRRGSGSRAGGARAGGPGSATWPASGWRTDGPRSPRALARGDLLSSSYGSAGGRPKRGIGGARFIASLPGRPGGGQRSDGGLEGPPAGGVVDEHVEAGGGRAEQHGRGPAPGPALPARARASASARTDRVVQCRRPLDDLGEAGGAEAAPEVRAALADDDRRDRPLGDDRRQGRQVDVLVAAAGDEHDRCRRTRAARR